MIKADSEKLTFRSWWGSKAWANDELRYAVLVLKGQAFISDFKGRLAVALYIKEVLDEAGFPWQAERVENWVRFFSRQYQDLEARDPRDPSGRPPA